MKYFINSFNRTPSNEGTIVSAVMDFAQREWEHRLIEDDRVGEIVQSLKDEERRILDARPRLKPAGIYADSCPSSLSGLLFIHVGWGVSFSLVPVKD